MNITETSWLSMLLEHRPALRRLARRYTRSVDDLEEIVQEAFVRAWARPPTHATAIVGWLRCVVRSVVIERSRKSHAERERLAHLVRERATTSSHEPPCEVEEVRRKVAEAVASLPRGLRRPVELRYFCEQSIGSIAAQLGLSEKTTRRRLHRAMNHLKPALHRLERGSPIGGLLPFLGFAWVKRLWGEQVVRCPSAFALPGLTAGLLALALGTARLTPGEALASNDDGSANIPATANTALGLNNFATLVEQAALVAQEFSPHRAVIAPSTPTNVVSTSLANGLVIDGKGLPVAGAQVLSWVSDVLHHDEYTSPVSALQCATTDAAGAVTIPITAAYDKPPPVCARGPAPHDRWLPSTVEHWDSTTRHLIVRLREVPLPASALVLSVHEEASAKPLSATSVSVRRRDRSSPLPAPPDDVIKISCGQLRINRLHAGAWRIRIDADMHTATSIDVNIPDGLHTVRASIELPPVGRISGYVSVDRSHRAQLVSVVAEPLSEVASPSIWSWSDPYSAFNTGKPTCRRVVQPDSTGQFVFDDIPPGLYSVRLQGAARALGVLVRLQGGTTSHVSL